jgi:hypothetical protein
MRFSSSQASKSLNDANSNEDKSSVKFPSLNIKS